MCSFVARETGKRDNTGCERLSAPSLHIPWNDCMVCTSSSVSSRGLVSVRMHCLVTHTK